MDGEETKVPDPRPKQNRNTPSPVSRSLNSLKMYLFGTTIQSCLNQRYNKVTLILKIYKYLVRCVL